MFNRSASRKQSAYEAEVMPHVNALYGMAFKLTGNSCEAEDLVQDALLKAYRFFDKFEEGTNCKAWLFKILTNTFINKHRKKIRQAEVLSGSTEETMDRAVCQEDAGYGVNPEKAFFRKVLMERINETLDKIPVDFRMVVILADLEDFSYREIADILDCPIGTVMSRLYRGRRQLQARLADFVCEGADGGILGGMIANKDKQETGKAVAVVENGAMADADSEIDVEIETGTLNASGQVKVTNLDEYRRKMAVGQ